MLPIFNKFSMDTCWAAANPGIFNKQIIVYLNLLITYTVNVITNLHVPVKDSKVLYRSWEVIPKAPLWSVVGSVPTTTNYTTTIINDDNPHGEIIILPSNKCCGISFQ